LISFSTVVFDVGGTLLQLDYDALATIYIHAAAVHNITLDWNQVRTVLENLEGEMPQLQQKRAVSLEHDHGIAFWNDFYAEGFRRLGVTHDMSPVVNEIRERFQRAEFEKLFEDVVPTLEAFAARGTRLGILSNFSANLEDVLRQAGIHQYFDFFVVSAIAGVEKPDRRIFDLTVSAANRPRAEIVYIGDSVFHDIEGARNAGIAAILVDRQNRHPEFNGARVRDLRELVR
jgi:putative hydrolase of the HAD superfamily